MVAAASKRLGESVPSVHKPHRSIHPFGRSNSAAVILFVDPRPLIRECLARWLEATARNFRILAISDPAEVSGSGASPENTDLVLVNIAGAEVSEGQVTETIAALRRALPDAPIVFLADREEIEQVVEAIRQGVRGYIPTSLPLSAAVEALRFVRAGGTFVPASALVQPARPAREAGEEQQSDGGAETAGVEEFTSREVEVLARLCEGKPNKVIAYELDIRDSTVKVHVHHIMKKLKATNRTQVAFLARRLFESRARASGGEDSPPGFSGSRRHGGGPRNGPAGQSGPAATR